MAALKSGNSLDNRELLLQDKACFRSLHFTGQNEGYHHSDVRLSAMTSQITGAWIVCTTVCSDAYKEYIYQSSTAPVDSPLKGPVTRKMFPFDDVIMVILEVRDWGPDFNRVSTALEKSLKFISVSRSWENHWISWKFLKFVKMKESWKNHSISDQSLMEKLLNSEIDIFFWLTTWVNKYVFYMYIIYWYIINQIKSIHPSISILD